MIKTLKKIIPVLMVICLLSGYTPAFTPTASAAAFNVDTRIEAESGLLPDSLMQARASSSASGRQCIVYPSGARIDSPNQISSPDASYSINIPEKKTYYVVLRYSSADEGTDSFWCRWNGNAYTLTATTVTGASWGWIDIGKVTLNPGVNTFDIIRRESGTVLDMFVVTANPAGVDKAGIDADILANSGPKSPDIAVNSTAVTFDLYDGAAMFEAEACTLSSAYQIQYNDANASGSGYVVPALTTSAAPSVDLAGLEFNFNITRNATYSIWARYAVRSGGEDSIWISFDGANYAQPGNSYGITDPNGYTYGWTRLAVTGTLEAGTKHNFRLYPREGGGRIDKFIVTSNAVFTPTGMGDPYSGSSATLPPNVYPVPTILPPESHPRLYFTAADIPDIKANMSHPQNATAFGAYQSLLQKDYDGKLGNSIFDNATNYNASILAAIEAWAFKYAIDGDTSYGSKAISAMKNYLETATFGEKQDITREMGHTIFVASEIYDWCYPLLTPSEKNLITLYCESIAAGMEVGYPPKGQGAVCGHAGEAQLLRDLLSLGVATYGDRSDIYNYVAGRLLSQFVRTRNYWYDSNTYHQGDSYGGYRYTWDVMFQWIIYRMTGGDHNPNAVKILSAEQANVPYEWLYTRRGDGEMFRTGDCYNESQSARAYWNVYATPMFYSSNFWKDAYIKGEYDIESPNKTLNNGTFTLSGVHYLLFNDPTVAGNQNKQSLPLTRYFGSPNGMMIARTGWETNPEAPAANDDVVAMMKVGEQWGANHNHLDAGNFQIYYKGILASESGFYESYGTRHDGNYNKRSIAHNTLTIYQPGESFGTYKPTTGAALPPGMANGFNDGGQRWPNGGGEPATWEIWQNGQYETGKVLDHAFGPDPMTPAYTYIKGDITKAYSSSKVSEVLRAMAFMPLEDPNYKAVMVVMDKVTSTNASYKKKWLLHTQEAPAISGTTSFVTRTEDGYNGKLTVQTLLPKNASVTAVGGEGYAFWVGRQDGNFLTEGENLAPQVPTDGTTIEAGWGRIEVSPPAANLKDTFLNVMAVSDADGTTVPLASTLIEGTNLTGVKTAGKVLMFSDVTNTSANKNRIETTASFTVPGGESSLDVLIAGAKEGQWRVMVNGTAVATPVATAEGGTLYFSAPAGSYTLTYLGAAASLPVTINSINITNKTAGAVAQIAVSATGTAAGAKVMLAVYDGGGRLMSISSQPYAGSNTYNFSYTLPQSFAGMTAKAFVWGSDGMTPVSAAKPAAF